MTFYFQLRIQVGVCVCVCGGGGGGGGDSTMKGTCLLAGKFLKEKNCKEPESRLVGLLQLLFPIFST